MDPGEHLIAFVARLLNDPGFDQKERLMRITGMLVIGLVCSAVAMAAPEGKNFHDQDVRGKTFENASLNHADFSDATAIHVRFDKASLKGADFKGANLQDAAFDGADLTDADFRGATGDIWFKSTVLNGANFEGCKFGLSQPGYECKCRGTIFRKTVLKGNISGCDFTGADFCGANIRGADLSNLPCIFKKAKYDEDTVFPEGFDPVERGMILVKPVEVEKKK